MLFKIGDSKKFQIKSCNFQIYGLSTNTILDDLTCVFNEAFIVLYSKSMGAYEKAYFKCT